MTIIRIAGIVLKYGKRQKEKSEKRNGNNTSDWHHLLIHQ